MKHKESDLQIRCIKWFRYQYPPFAMLMHHPKNEGHGNRRQGAIAKAEGVTPGVADIILHVPSYLYYPGDGSTVSSVSTYTSLAIEMKTSTGRQSPEQRQWQRLFEASGGRYVIIRSYDEFVSEVTRYMISVPIRIADAIRAAHRQIEDEKDRQVVSQLKKFLKQE